MEVLQWCRDYEEELTRLRLKCRDYETEVAYMKRQGEISIVKDITYDIHRALRRADKCHVFYDGKFKVLTQPERILKEESTLVGIYDSNFTREKLFEDLKCNMNDAMGITVL